ncbi:glycosyltransferase family 2 protein [Mongoliimonas terrestris]|uniref:glycosyltransferase family 2 protein n=1 Tax=Mongoliimonas terrestris TaxID=1709001 RepID=UPI000A6E2A25|nr:glycosyltransferase [Mongoliimonas terrestris]
MTSLPLVSVLVPAYNHSAYVAECLDSILSDGYPNLEVLVLDDGSADGTYEVAAAWRDAHPDAFHRFVLERQANQGVNTTLNRLIRMASGSHVALLGSDDRLLPGGIAARIAALRHNPQWRAVFGDCELIDGSGALTHPSAFDALHGADRAALADPMTLNTELIWRWSVPGPVLLVERAVYTEPGGYGFYPEDRIVEDRHFYLTLLANRQIGYIDVKVAAYRLHGANVSRTRGVEIERQNREAELILARSFVGRDRWGLRFKLFTYTLQARHLEARFAARRLIGRAARKLDYLVTRVVLARNARRAARRVATTGRRRLVAAAPIRRDIDVSIIVATHNRSTRLVPCMEAVRAAVEAAPDHKAEFIIVANACPDDTYEVARDWARRQAFPVQVLWSPVPGACGARNLGMAIARGGILAITDDDCCLAPDFVSAVVAAHAEDAVPSLRGGQVLLGDPDTLPMTIKTDPNPAVYAWPIFPGAFLHGCNFTFPASLLATVGWFDIRFGPGSPAGAAEDTDWIYRAHLAGVPIHYDPRLVVSHFHGRASSAELARLVKTYNRSDGAFIAKHMVDRPDVLRWVWWDVRTAGKELFRGPQWQADLGLTYRRRVVQLLCGLVRFRWQNRDARRAMQAELEALPGS